MAAVTTAVVAGGSALYSANRQSSAAKDAARQQARGVENARQDTLAATDRARSALMGGSPYGMSAPQQMPSIQPSQPDLSSLSPRPSGSGLLGRVAGRQWDARANELMSQPQPVAMPANQFSLQQPMPDPRQDYLQGIQSGLQFTNQGFGQAQNTLNPLAQLAQPYIDEQYNLSGLGGNEAYQSALSRVADPLVQAQEQAILRNNAALGGVGGNVLSALADQTRQRTEANIGNRLSQLAMSGSPALNALQQRSNMQLNQGLRMADIMQGAGAGLADMETNRRNALANIEIGQGAQMSQLAQNLGTARAGGSAYAAQNAPALTQGLAAGLNAFSGMGGLQQLQNNNIGNRAFDAINTAGLF